MNAVNDTCELIEAELDLVAGGKPPPHYEFDVNEASSYGAKDFLTDFIITVSHC